MEDEGYSSCGSSGSVSSSFSSVDSDAVAGLYGGSGGSVSKPLLASRRMVAEDIGANLPLVPALTELCIGALVAHFDTHPCLAQLPRKYQDKVLALLDPRLPLPLTAPIIAHESYWKRVVHARLGPDVDVSDHGGSWKRALFEILVARALAKCSGEPGPDLLRLVALGAPHIKALKVEVPGDASLGVLLKGAHALPRLAQLRVNFGAGELGMGYDASLLRASTPAVRALSGALVANSELVVLDVVNSGLDDAMTRVLVAGLLENHSVTSLSLAHNKIGDRGARALAKYIATSNSVLAELDLEDNVIGEAGGVALGHALHTNSPLLELNLRLNRLSDGCAYVCAGLVNNATLTSLNLAANSLDTVQGVTQLAELVRHNDTLTALDISANAIMSKLGAKLKDGIESNETLLTMDTRFCQLSREAELAIDNVLARNLERFREENGHYE